MVLHPPPIATDAQKRGGVCPSTNMNTQTHRKRKKGQEKERWQKDYDTWCSQVVSNPSTNQARRGLTSLIRREVVLSSWYGRNSFSFLCCSSFLAFRHEANGLCDVKQAHKSGIPFLVSTLFLQLLLSSCHFTSVVPLWCCD